MDPFVTTIDDDQPRLPEIIPAGAIEAQERASVDIQIQTAKRYPRPQPKVIQQRIASMAAMDQETAQECFYTLKRDGKTIQGPSIRLAEIALSQYGNIRAQARIVENDGKFVTAQGICHDLESNVAVLREVKRRITYKDGRTFSDDMQTVAANAACSIALRNVALTVVPRAIIMPVYEHCMNVAIGKAKPLEQVRSVQIEALAKMGVSVEQILAFLELEDVEQIELGHVKTLMGAAQAVKDGAVSLDEQFPPIAKKGKVGNGAKSSAPNPFAADPLTKAGDMLPGFGVDQKAAEELAKAITDEQYAALLAAGGNDQALVLETIKAAGYATPGAVKQRDYDSILAKVQAAKKGGAKK